MRTYRTIIMAAMLAAAVSCNKGIEPESASPIRFSAGIGTKAFLNSGDINVASTQLTVWGFENTSALIQGKTATYDNAGGWNLDKTYLWAADKSYSFFAWLNKDKDGNSVSGIDASTIESDRTLAVSTKAFNLVETDNAFDFCYSDVVYRPDTEADHSVVNLNLKHLYTSVAFTAHNYTSNAITIKEVSLNGLKNQKSANIRFADTGVEIGFPSAVCSWTNGVKTLNSGDIVIVKDAVCANLVGNGTATAQYYMFWPQSSAELAASGWTDSDTQPSGGAYIKVVYEQDGTVYTKYAKFPEDNDGTDGLGWPAGTKRKMEIAFRDNMITLNLLAANWEYSTPEIKYDDEVEVESVLEFDESTCTVDKENHKVYFLGANPITGSFKFSSPSEATWIISKIGDYDAFEIDNASLGANGLPASKYGDKLDCNFGAVDITAGNKFTLYPMVATAGKDYSIQLSFSIRYPDGESYCIDDKIQLDDSNQPVKWTIILTK